MLTSQSIWLNDVNESASAPKCQELMKVKMIIHAHALLVENSMPRSLPELEADNPVGSFEQSRPDQIPKEDHSKILRVDS